MLGKFFSKNFHRVLIIYFIALGAGRLAKFVESIKEIINLRVRYTRWQPFCKKVKSQHKIGLNISLFHAIEYETISSTPRLKNADDDYKISFALCVILDQVSQMALFKLLFTHVSLKRGQRQISHCDLK